MPNTLQSGCDIACSSSFMTHYSEPNQPQSSESIYRQQRSDRSLSFQVKWFSTFPWLHYSPELKSVVCFICAKANSLGLLSLATKSEPAFISAGFCNWKKAIEKFHGHEKSGTHSHAVSQMQQIKSGSLVAHLTRQKEREQHDARIALVTIFSSIRFLARQGLALRGHDSDSGNFNMLVKLRCEDVPELQLWTQRTTSFMSPESQNEMLNMLHAAVLENIVHTINSESRQFAVMVDGTQDCTGFEQESICIRYVDCNLKVQEVFVSLEEPSDTRGATIADEITKCLSNLQLPIDELRAQTYDGAANMSGKDNGCRAHISAKHPLALWFHCGAHCANLTGQAAASCSPHVRDAIAYANELGVLYSRSTNYKTTFNAIASVADGSYTTLKPLCPTRWLCRADAIRTILNQYEAVLDSLLHLSTSSVGDTGTKASGLYHHFNEEKMCLLLQIALNVFEILEQLNRSLQARSATISGMIEAVDVARSTLKKMRSDEAFADIRNNTATVAKKLDLKLLEKEKPRRPPTRYTGTADAYVAPTVEDHYRRIYFAVIDMADNQLSVRFDPNSLGIRTYLRLENLLLTGKLETGNTDEIREVTELVNSYPEFNLRSLTIQLAMFRSQFKYSDLQGAVDTMRAMSSCVRRLFVEVEQLIRLLLICPVSSCEAERSFSALRRLKTWLRNTMTDARLNAVAVCHVHQHILDSIDLVKLAATFASKSTIRQNLFGKFTNGH